MHENLQEAAKEGKYAGLLTTRVDGHSSLEAQRQSLKHKTVVSGLSPSSLWRILALHPNLDNTWWLVDPSFWLSPSRREGFPSVSHC